MSGRRVAIAIGVADAKPLPFLSGALNGAKAFHHWADQLGYESALVTDEDAKPVTVPRLRAELEAMLNAGGSIHRLILYFAGHGLIQEMEQGLWLLSDWKKELRAVDVERLKRRLYRHNIRQLAIFSDSCRSLAVKIDTADLAADPVLGDGPHEINQPDLDRFTAAQDGEETFMVPGDTPEEDRCLFSGLLMEALWGARPGAYSKVVQDKVTSASLRDFLKLEIPELAKRYKRRLDPVMSPSFADGDNIYFPEGPSPKAPVFAAWPDVAVGSMGVDGGGTPTKRRQVRKRASPTPTLIEEIQQQKRPAHFETGAGFAVDGGDVAAFWAPGNVAAERYGQPNWWRLHDVSGSILTRSAPILIEFQDGLFAAVAALPNFVATVLRDQRGVAALLYRPLDSHPDSALGAEMALDRMDRGAIRADEVYSLAVTLRQQKHADPVLGVISAYLYESIGDIGNIRRMAFYYAMQQQPIPYDIALLGHLRGEIEGGRLRVDIPAVAQSIPRDEAEQWNMWTHEATPACRGEVGGRWPWMRQGWALLEDGGPPLAPLALADLAERLTPGRFSSLPAEAAKALAQLFGLVRRGT